MNSPFESIKKRNEFDQEFWSARELMPLLGYVEWRKFEGVIEKAKLSCLNNQQNINDHFGGDAKMVSIGSEAIREILDFRLSRYACYLIAQNGDSRKPEIANAQNYFAIQTRKQEISEQFLEDQKRVFLRDELKQHNADLAKAASRAGVKNYGTFQNYGYMGLYGGLKAKDIHEKKQLKKSQNILDHMGSEELAANLFRATQAEAKLKREKISGEKNANYAHYSVGKKVRQTIEELGGTMPEKLPTPEDIKKVERKMDSAQKQDLKGVLE